MDNKSEDSSDFEVVAASLIQKKKSGPQVWSSTMYKKDYQDMWLGFFFPSSFRQPPSTEQKTAQRLCCTFGGPAEAYKVV